MNQDRKDEIGEDSQRDAELDVLIEIEERGDDSGKYESILDDEANDV